MLGKSKLVIEIMTFAVTGLALLLPGIGATTACACVSVDWLAAESVNRLDALVHQYAAEHGGLYPTYDELVTMAEQRDKKYMTPQVDIATRNFLFGQARWMPKKLVTLFPLAAATMFYLGWVEGQEKYVCMGK